MASYDEVIPPGKVGQVIATLDTHKLRGSVGRGITVYTDDPRDPSLLLTIRAEVVGGASVLPQESLFLSGAGPGAAPGFLLVQREPSETLNSARPSGVFGKRTSRFTELARCGGS